MLEDELSLLVYIILYPISQLFNMFMSFVNELLGVFTGIVSSVYDIIVSFHIMIESIVSIVLPPELSVFVLIIVYILTAWFIIKFVKAFWDVLPFV